MKDVSFQVDTMDTSLFDALIRVAVLHDHYVYVAQTSMTKLTIHAVTNRVLTVPSRPHRLTRTMGRAEHPLVWEIRPHLRKVVSWISLSAAHARSARSTVPSTPLPVTASPEQDVRLAYFAALSSLLLVPLLILVVVKPGGTKRRQVTNRQRT